MPVRHKAIKDDPQWRTATDPTGEHFAILVARAAKTRFGKVASQTLDHGVGVVLDQGFTKVPKRTLFADLAENVQFHILTAPHILRRRQRVLSRNIERGSTFAFEVSPGMFDFTEGE